MIYETVIHAWGLKRGFPKIGVSLLGGGENKDLYIFSSIYILGPPIYCRYVKRARKGSCKSLVKGCCRA